MITGFGFREISHFEEWLICCQLVDCTCLKHTPSGSKTLKVLDPEGVCLRQAEFTPPKKEPSLIPLAVFS
mgnify:CR=1 FL=1